MLSSNTSAVSGDITYIEDVFSTYLYTGDSSTQTITNGIDLSTKGGMVWIKSRKQTDGTTSPIGEHGIWDTARGVGTSGSVNKALSSNSTAAQNLGWTDADYVSAFNSTGFTVQNGAGTTTHRIANHAFQLYSSWTFRKQPKFFDVVTWTGNATARTIAHNLGSVPGCIMIKCLNTTFDWIVWHRSMAANNYNAFLNTTDAAGAYSVSSSTAPTSTEFSLTSSAYTNENGSTYVAYLFAHDAGGFGLTGTDNVISCGTFTTDGSGNATVNLGYEAQWVLLKKTSGAESWMLFDSMRGLVVQPVAGNYSKKLVPNLTNAEADGNECSASSTGFNVGGVVAGATYVYVAIRRGPMKVPTDGTTVFSPQTSYSVETIGGTSYALVTPNFPVDTYFWAKRSVVENRFLTARLLGNRDGFTNTTDSFSNNLAPYWNSNTRVAQSSATIGTQIYECFRRAPSFHDVVCYTGTGSLRTVSHNLGAVPELLIVKRREAVEDWNVYSATTGNAAYLRLNTTAAVGTVGADALWGSTTPTSSVFTVKTSGGTNASGGTYVAYLFATCAGVSKVGSYTGTGTTKQVDCGFAAGARFVLIKRTDSTGDWYVWDTARGIVSGNDPYWLLNSDAAEVTTTDYIDTYSAGFELSSTAPAALNASGGTYIFLAIA